ncbi:hypothetical protein [Streptomyces sp. NPDC018352]|uniref:hypothetical protein n=1 Tax=Streptomyces sp. NPDC018352 TaxID=3157194 RepID=UPI0033E2026A
MSETDRVELERVAQDLLTEAIGSAAGAPEFMNIDLVASCLPAHAELFTMATMVLPLLIRHGADGPVWRVVGIGHGEERRALVALPKAR